MKCENCGNNIEPGKDICPVCGKEQHNYDRPDYFGRNKRGRGSDLRVVIITLLVAVPCMVVLLIFAFRLGNNSNQDKVTAATVTDASEEQGASDQKEVTSLEEQGVPADVFSSAGNAAKSQDYWVFFVDSADFGIKQLINIGIARNTAEKQMIDTDEANSFLIEWLYKYILYSAADCQKNIDYCDGIIAKY